MYKTPKEVYDFCCPDFVYDHDLYQRIKLFRINWTQKDDTTMEFLSHNLTGVYPVRFSALDEEVLWNTIGLDPKPIQQEIYDIKGLSKNLRTVTNVTYATLMWFAHKFTISNMSKDDIEDAVRECYYIFIYKIVGSLTAHYFKYTIDESVAKAINERMTNKFLIKRLGSWQELFEYKATDLLPNGIHYKRLISFTTDDMIRIISDLDTKMRDIFKNNYGAMLKVKNNQERIKSTSLVQVDQEGKESIKDITSRHDLAVTKIRQLIINKVDFINYDLVDLITLRVKVINANDLQDVLEYLTTIDTKTIDKYLEAMISNSIMYMSTKGIFNNYKDKLYQVINICLSYWKAGNIKDKISREIKTVFFELVEEKLPDKPRSIIFNLSVATIVYIVVLCFI